MTDPVGDASIPQDEADGRQGEVPATPNGIQQLLRKSQFGFQFGPAEPHIIEKLTTEQIGQLIKNDGADAAGRRHLNWGLLIVGAFLFLSTCALFLAYDQGALLEKVLTHMVAFLGGAGIGWGIRHVKE